MRVKIILLLCSLLLTVSAAAAQDATAEATADVAQAATEAPQGDIPAATIENDEGGPVTITGNLTYTDLLFTSGVSEPIIILEDQGGFVVRDRHFLIPVESQVLGQLTSDFFTSPVSYTLSLPEVPNGTYRDVDHDGQDEEGVQVFAVAYWYNIWGDPYLEVRDQGGGGWSGNYASTRISPDPSQQAEVIGGKYVVYAPDDQQDFPSGFGADGKLFTDDDPLVRLPQGYTVVDLDANPFSFDRSREPVIDLIENEAAQLVDYSNMSYADAFKGLVAQMREEYAFTELKNIDWDALEAEFLPRFEKADETQDAHEYFLAVRDFSWAIPDGHVGSAAVSALTDDFVSETAGGLGMAIRELDDGRVIVNFILPDGPAEQAGIELKAEIKAWDGQPIEEALAPIVPWSSPFSNEIGLKLQQLRYITRSPLGSEVTVTYRNPGAAEDETATLTSVEERDSFAFSSLAAGGATTGFELPVEYRLLDSGYAYVEIFSFFDNSRLSIELWERMIQTLNEQGIPGLIIDMRHNGGGDGWLAAQMAAYFFDDPVSLYRIETYDKSKGEFYSDPAFEFKFYPPEEQFRYHGQVAVLVGPNCASACEFFSYNMTQQDRAEIIGQYPTAGMGGGIDQVLLPLGVPFQFPKARNLDPQGNIIIEGPGVVPTVKVPVDEETLFSDGDPILDAAIQALDEGAAPS